jgi:molecular chaperone HscA
MQLLKIQEPHATTDKRRVAVGIDFGTTNSLVAYSSNKEPQVFYDRYNNKKIPSVLSVNINQEIAVGSEAENSLNEDKTVFVRSIKRLIGKSKKDIGRSFSSLESIIERNGKILFSLNGLDLSVEEISARILQKIKEAASDNLGEDVSDIVVTVPAYFDEVQRRVVKTAAESVGMHVMRMINEPTAAALAYQLDQIDKGTYLVYDLGGGTFDVSILDIQKGVFKVVSTGGDSDLGGDDFDYLIAKEIEKEVEGIKFSAALAHGRKIKEHLTEEKSHQVLFENTSFSITRRHFESVSKDLLDRTIKVTRNTLSDADLEYNNISGVILVGGSTRMPCVKEALISLFKGVKIYNSINPDEVVAIGASLQAENLTHGSGDLLLDVTPLSLGLEIMGGMNEKIIHRNSTIPCSVSKEFTTYENGQTGLKLHITQGEREMSKDCRSLANFELKGIPPMEAGSPRIVVNFTIDSDGLLTVSAEEKVTGVIQSIEVIPTYGLSGEDVENSLKQSMKNMHRDNESRLLTESKINEEKTTSRVSSYTEKDKGLITEE